MSVSNAVSRRLVSFIAAMAVMGLTACTTNHASGPSTNADGGTNGVDGGPIATSGELPCDVNSALSFCRGCHANPPKYGAPMPLMTYADTQKPAVTDPSKKVYEMMGVRINSTTSPMPPSPWGIKPADKTTLNDWINAGAPPAPTGQGCTAATDTDGGVPQVGPQYLPCTPTYTFTAHDPTDPNQGFTVPTGGSHNYYECFVFDAPFKAGEQGTAWAPIIDQASVLHHWILYEAPPGTTTWPDGVTPMTDGSVNLCGAIPTINSKFLMGWAPGGENTVLPSDVGLRLDPGSKLLLQIHYWNALDATGIKDKSGIAMCTTTTARTHEAGIMAVGNLNINLPPHQTTSVVANCTSSAIQTGLTADGIADTSQIHILADGPHMHLIGTKFSTVLNHSDGTSQTLVNVDPFDFNNQTGFPQNPPVTMDLTGTDSLTTTCTYDNESNTTVKYGERTEDEMCFDFMMVYPLPVSPIGGMFLCPSPF